MKAGRLIMGCLYVGAGALHFYATSAYLRLMPSYLPAHRGLVLVSGAAEIAGGLGILAPQTRNAQPGRAAAWGAGGAPICGVSRERHDDHGPWPVYGCATVGGLAAASAADSPNLVGVELHTVARVA